MSKALENMTKEQLQALVLEQQNKIQVKNQEIQVKNQEIQTISEENNKLLKRIKDMLEKFTSMKFELSQLKRLVYGSKRERFVSGGEDAQMSLPFDTDTPSQDENHHHCSAIVTLDYLI